MNLRDIVLAFKRWRARGTPLVLATVITTSGSTYTKPGTFMLLDAEGKLAGLLSGGCLEPDLAEHARGVIASWKPKLVEYDMRDRDADELWGLGLGCNGLMRVLLQPLGKQNLYEPFAAVANAIDAHEPGVLVLDTGADGTASLGAAAFVAADRCVELGLDGNVAAHAIGIAHATTRVHGARLEHDGQPYDLLFIPVPLPLRLLLLGAGPDAVPVLRLAQGLGWRVTIADHRAAHVSREPFRCADHRVVIDADNDIDRILGEQSYDAVVVMSHHLASDRSYLAALAATATRYIGLLGPPARKAALMNEIQADSAFAQRVHGPVGLDIGARGPDEIALSIVTQIQAELARDS